jgi:hypothetical protein
VKRVRHHKLRTKRCNSELPEHDSWKFIGHFVDTWKQQADAYYNDKVKGSGNQRRVLSAIPSNEPAAQRPGSYHRRKRNRDYRKIDCRTHTDCIRLPTEGGLAGYFRFGTM